MSAASLPGTAFSEVRPAGIPLMSTMELGVKSPVRPAPFTAATWTSYVIPDSRPRIVWNGWLKGTWTLVHDDPWTRHRSR